ncbi:MULTISPECIES: class C sortase [unclassified Ruminococcus]|uniref:class C sortase n=1 Tax=unclassified Ruminococcus TaxID=2608920 RepID=UPI00210BC543|nr:MULTISPECIES: class C sortase [unclassified Ruminococcus]MCQ4022020.1 class C sortase [Ruminococcus sp. zg-924]MCQ4114556.1 class C sortase [Ruminococcus sp. zg-921]
MKTKKTTASSKSTKSKKSSRTTKIIACLLLIGGVCVLFYPALGNVISYFQQISVVAEYEQQVAKLTKTEVRLQKELAIEYNKTLGQVTLQDPFENASDSKDETEPTEEDKTVDEYYQMLSLNDEHMMGFIKIPEITLTCPIYHGATEAQLQKGVGHLKGTSLPVGGTGTHCVLTGHTGVPGNMLFTDLEKLNIGDKFYLHILDEVLAYQIDQIEVVEPHDTRQLQIDRDKDLCTLVTCTPYGINSHRLLVRGARVEYMPGEDDYESGTIKTTDAEGNVVTKRVDGGSDEVNLAGIKIPKWVIWTMIPIGALIVLLIAVIIIRRSLRKRRIAEGKADEGEEEENSTDNAEKEDAEK